MDHTLLELIRARLEEEEVPESVAQRVLAACGATASATAADCGAPDGPASAWLHSLEVEGFRGIAEPVQLPLSAGPGLVVLAGRNGSGKSSVAEALEALLTGTLKRWGSPDFQQGWRNLHHEGACRVTARFVLEGRAQPVTLTRTWPGDNVKESELTLDGRPASLHALGWDDAVRTWRPILAGGLARKLEQRPSELFDAIAGVLGLEAVVAAYKRLADQRKEILKPGKELEQELQRLRKRLQGSDDPRAEQALTLLAHKEPSLEDLERLASSDLSGEHIDRWRRASTLELPSPDDLTGLADALRSRAARLDALSSDAVTQNEALADLLSRALALQERLADPDPMDCPLCGAPSALDAAWSEEARARILASQASAGELHSQRKELERRIREAHQQLQRPAPNVVQRLGDLDADGALAAVAKRWWSGREIRDARLLADHLERLWPDLAQAVEAVRAEARARLEAQHARWAPVAGELQHWVERRREADRAAQQAKQLVQAEQFLKDLEGELRTERFRPIRDQACALWEALGQESNVTLENIELLGRQNRRKLGLEVTVDGVDANALGVMSQGEINALALSLFVPRTIMEESPFRFVVIDDPVHAMDPHKVDGLARVLRDLAQSRQTLVFTHDQRLLESLRRLRIRATILQVERSTQSRVTLVPRKDPVSQCFDDVQVVMSARNTVPEGVMRRLVPGFCREALEARLIEIVRRRRLVERSERHEDVEDLLARHRSLVALLALALRDRSCKPRELEEAVRDAFGQDGIDVIEALNAGTHGDFQGSLTALVRGTKQLVTQLEGWS